MIMFDKLRITYVTQIHVKLKFHPGECMLALYLYN